MNTPRRRFLKTALLGSTLPLGAPGGVGQALGALGQTTAPAPKADPLGGTQFRLRGRVGEYLTAITEQWLKIAPLSNPAMLEMFRDRDRRPLREMVPWAGEFAGKYLTSAVEVWRLTRDPALEGCIRAFVARLVGLQAEDGYLGPWPKESRLTGHAPNIGADGGETWDAGVIITLWWGCCVGTKRPVTWRP